MTVAIAALAEDGKTCVIASDRQLSNLGLRFEIEHPLSKIEPLGGHHVAWAGDASYASEVLRRTRSRAKSGPLVEDLARDVRDLHRELHLERAESSILVPYNLTWEAFRDRGAAVPNHQAINEALFNYGCGLLEFLLAGVDANGAHVFRVAYDGVGGGNWIESCDRVGWRCVGTGGVIATLWLAMSSQHQRLSLGETLFNVYGAKRVAESATGVGTATDIVVVGENGAHVIDDAQIQRLQERWKESRNGMHQSRPFDPPQA